jgi:hypothetical protein
MHTERLQLAAGDRLRVSTVKGDLRLAASDGAELRLQVGEADVLSLQRQAGLVEVECRAGCLVFVPRDCPTSVGKVAGDLRVYGLPADLEIENVGGSLNLREAGTVSVGRVGGDLVARKLSGRLQATSVGGDAQLEDLQGDATLSEVGGDLRLRHVAGSVGVRAGGDIWLEFTPAAGTRSAIRAGGDLRCVLPAQASVWLEVHAGGDLALPVGVEAAQHEGKTRQRLGLGDAEISLDAGGNLRVRQMGEGERREIDAFVEEIHASVRAQVDGAIASSASGSESPNSPGSLPDGAAIARQVQESLRAAGIGRTGPGPASAGRGRATGRGGGQAENAEQMAILDMLQAGKINSQEAELLLRALEAGS